MDPNANLREQLDLASLIVNVNAGDTIDEGDTLRFSELVLALDEWLRNGGCLPTDWE